MLASPAGESRSSITVSDPSQVSAARRAAVTLAEHHKLDRTRAGAVAVVVTELATNLLKHAGQGEIHISDAGGALDILALDKGPGIPDISVSLRDGYSTSLTSGIGLGAVARMSDVFDIYSRPRAGTSVLSRFHIGSEPPPRTAGIVQAPIRGETVCGDSVLLKISGDVIYLLVADGLGHGPEAARASQAAVAVLNDADVSIAPANLIRRIHGALRTTRGAAIAVARIGPDGKLAYSGLGNISGLSIDPAGKTQHLISHAGTAGHQAGRIQEFVYPVTAGWLVMFSDGLQTSWTFDKFPELLSHDPAIAAGVLYRDLSRGRDDVTVAVVKF